VSDDPQSIALVAPANLQASTANNEGELKCKWNRVRGASSYVVECAGNPNGPWTQVTVTTKSSHTASGLTSGTKYWFRVRAVGAEGFGPWSDLAVKMAA
jgi:chitodextrinase